MPWYKYSFSYIRYLHLFVIMEDTSLSILSALYIWRPNFRALYGRSCLETHFPLPCHSHISICSSTCPHSIFPMCMWNIKRSKVSWSLLLPWFPSTMVSLSTYMCINTHTYGVYMEIYIYVCTSKYIFIYIYPTYTHDFIYNKGWNSH